MKLFRMLRLSVAFVFLATFPGTDAFLEVQRLPSFSSQNLAFIIHRPAQRRETARPTRSPQKEAFARYQTHLCLSPGISTWVEPAGLVLLHVLGGLVGVPFVAEAVNKPCGVDPEDAGLDGWYTRIDLPSWTPPNRIFAPVWTLLYASMGLSLHLVLKHTQVTPSRRTQLAIMWSVHYLSNLIWAPIFFGMQRLRLGFYINCWLTISLFLWMVLLGHFHPFSAALLL